MAILTTSQTNMISAPSYSYKNFNPDNFQELVWKTAETIKEVLIKHPEIKALAACGHSGLLLMGAVSYLLKLPQIAVRKGRDSVHSSNIVDGWLGCGHYLIIDDFVASGNTVDHIIGNIADQFKAQKTYGGGDNRHCTVPKPAAILTYDHWNVERLTVAVAGERLEIPMYSINVRLDASPVEMPRFTPKANELLGQERKRSRDDEALLYRSMPYF